MSDESETEPRQGDASAVASAEDETEPAPRGRRRALVAGIGIMAVALPLWIRVGVEGSAELERAESAHAQHDPHAEIEHLGRALRWRAPLLGHDEEALERLWVRAEEHQARGTAGLEPALAAYREIRRGLLATRAWGIPHRDRWEQANERIAALMAEQERVLGTDVSETGDPEAFHRGLLDRVPGPDPTRGTMAAFAFLGWLGAVGGFLLRGLDERGRLRARPALRWGGAALVLLVVWAVLLATAHPGA